MKKVTTVFGTILFCSLILISCSSKSAKDIDVTTLSTSCDHIDAVLKIHDEVVVIKQKSSRKGWDDLDEETQQLLIDLKQKEKKIIEQEEKNKENSDYEDCDFSKKLDKSSNSLPMYYLTL